MNKENIDILNFSGIYEREDFYNDIGNPRFIDMRDIRGTDCICDDNAKKEILNRLRDCNCKTGELHFIDSGNYHYISSLFMDGIKEPFTLIYFDNHPDAGEPVFGGLLSCGNWVRHEILNNPFLCQIILIGSRPELDEEIEQECRGRIETFHGNEGYISEIAGSVRYPVYISVDKDVISANEIETNWDQGVMRQDELLAKIAIILNKCNIIGIDICGECSCNSGNGDKEVEGNNSFNRNIAEMILSKF